MRKTLTAILSAAGLAVAAPAFAAMTVHIDETAPVALGGQAAQVIVANPSVADVSIVDRRHLMILGRAYGSTGLTVLDGMGRRIFETTVSVAPPATGRVSLFRGAEVYNYACSDRCERTPMPGESTSVYQGASGPYTDYAGRAKGASGGPNGGG